MKSYYNETNMIHWNFFTSMFSYIYMSVIKEEKQNSTRW